MKKAILSLLALPLLLACSSEENEIVGNAGRVPLQIEFGDITRAALEGSTLPDSAQYGVFAASTTAPYNSLLENGENRCVTYVKGKSIFDQNVYIPEGGMAYVWAYYPHNVNINRIVLSDGWTIDATKQVDYLASSSYVTATETSPTVKLNMRHLLSRIHITVKKAADNTTDYYYKEAWLNNAYCYGRYSFTKSTMTVEKTTTTLYGYTTNNNSSLQDGKTVEFDFMVLPTTTNYVMNLELPNSSPVLKTALPSRKYVAGEQYNITLTINHLGQLTAGEWTIVPWETSTQGSLNVWKDDKTGEEDTPTPKPTEGEIDGHAYVDLGLPSGTLWATCNVGASKPEEFGSRFAWGETETKQEYSYENYKWGNGTYKSMTKYCINSEYGTIDNKTTLELSDDAAYIHWGGKWRMPIHEEMVELAANCSAEFTEVNNAKVYKLTGPNGKFLYLPADVTYSDCATSYWTTEMAISEGTSLYIHMLYLNKKDSPMMRSEVVGGRARGNFVRPVIHVGKNID